MAKASGSTKTSTSTNPRGISNNVIAQHPVLPWAESVLAQASIHTQIEPGAVVMYKDVQDPSDAWTRYQVREDRGDRVLMYDMNYSTSLGPDVKVALKRDLKLYRKNK